MSFRFRFVFSFIIIETAFMIAIVFMNFNSLERESRQLMNDKTQLASTMFSEVVSTAIIVNDLATLDDAAKRFVAIDGVVKVQLYNDAGELLSDGLSDLSVYESKELEVALDDNLDSVEKNENGVRQVGELFFLTVSDPISVEGSNVGSANFVYDISRSVQALRSNAFWTYLLASLEILISTGIALFTGFRIATAVDKLSVVTNEIAQNRPAVIPKYRKRGDEIDRLYGSVEQMQNNIIQRNADLMEESVKARAASKAKSDFLATMSHEIRTPINGVIGSLSAIDLKDLSERDSTPIKTALSSAEILMTTVSDILDFSKIETGKLSIFNVPISIRRFIKDIENVYRPIMETQGLSFVVETEGLKDDYFFADPIRIKQIINNYLNNAIKFSEKGTVTLKAFTRSSDGQIGFSVTDQGIGIKNENFGALFQQFSQIDSGANRAHGGTGLGLVIVSKLVELMNGTVDVQSVYGKGSCFSTYLPLIPATAEDYLSTQPIKEVKEDSNGNQLTADVLLVEDNMINQKVAMRLLEKAGCTVTVAVNGVEAIDQIQQASFDVVLMDCQMPVMDGLTATTKIREFDDNTPIIALTANAQDSDREACMKVGMNDFVSKPFRPDTLLSSIKNQMARVSVNA